MSTSSLELENIRRMFVRAVSPRDLLIEPTNLVDDPSAYFPGTIGMANAQAELDQRIVEGRVMRATPGTRLNMVLWNGLMGIAVGFDPNGVQVGYSTVVLKHDPDRKALERRMISYDTLIVVATQALRQGIGYAMIQFLEEYVALCNKGVGAAFYYHIEAETPGAKTAAAKIIKRLGGKPTGDHFTHIVLKPQYRTKTLVQTPGITVLSSNKPVASVNYTR